jgi:uncharacterized membrane protein
VATELDDAPGEFWSRALGISADGTVIVGTSLQSFADVAVRWSLGVPSLLETLPGDLTSAAVDASGDGAVVVGYSADSQGFRRAFIGDAVNGMRDLWDVLVQEGNDLSGWTLTEATGVSDDGRAIVGFGDNPDALERGWVATLGNPEVPLLPWPFTLLLCGGLLGTAAAQHRWRQRRP